MSNIRFVTYNQLDDLTLSSSEVLDSTNLPITNLKRSERSNICRFDNSTVVTITGTTAANITHTSNCLWLGYYSFDLNATITVTLKNNTVTQYTNSFQTDVQLIPLGTWQAGVDPYGGYNGDYIRRMIGIYFDASYTYDEVIITIDDTNSNATYFDLGRILIGKWWSPAINPSYGAKLEWGDHTIHSRAWDGSLYSISSSSFRMLTLDFEFIGDADRFTFENEFQRRNRANDFFVSVYPTVGGIKEYGYMFIGKRDITPLFNSVFYNNNSMKLIVSEV